MNSLWRLCLVAPIAFSVLQGPEPLKITTVEGRKHIGETVTVCGKVAGARISKYKVSSRGRPLILNLDEPEPNPVFLVVTWASASPKPERPEDLYQGKQICVTGKITQARGVPQIMTPDPLQIHLQSDETK